MLSDIDAIRVYADPTLTASEKIARIRGGQLEPIGAAPLRREALQPIPAVLPELAAVPLDATAQVPPEAAAVMRSEAGRAPVEGEGHRRSMPDVDKLPKTTPPVVQQKRTIDEERAQLDDIVSSGRSTAEAVAPLYAALEAKEKGLGATFVGPGAGTPEAPTELVDAEAEPAPGGDGDFRGFVRRSLLRGGPGGAAPKPTERVRIEEQLQAGAGTPEDFDELGATQQLRDYHAMEAARLQAGLDADSAAIQSDAAAKVQREREALAEVRRRTLEKVEAARARQNEISEQIAATDPVEPSLWAGKDFGGKLLTLLSVGLFTGSAIASKDPKAAAEAIGAMANREADRQARWLEMRKGARDELGTIIERHMGNFDDAELAHRATVVDILGAAEMRLQQMLEDPRTSQIQSHKLMAQQAALREIRQREKLGLQADMGGKYTKATAVEFVQERRAEAARTGLQPQTAPTTPGAQQTPTPVEEAPAPPAAPGATGPADPAKAAKDKAIADELAQVEAQTEAFRTTPQGQAPPKPAAPKPAPAAAAPKVPAKPTTKPAAAPAATGPTKPAKAEDRFQLARKAFRAGNFDAVDQVLTDRDWQAINVITKKYKQAGSTGGTGGSASEEEARAYAIADYLGMELPSAYVPASARPRLVKLWDGSNVFGLDDNHAQELRKITPNTTAVLDSLNKLIRIADMAGRGVTPKLKSDAENTAQAAMFFMSTAMDQGVVREGELEIWKRLAGGNLADYILDPRRDAKAGVEATIGVLRRGLRRKLQGASLDPFGERQYKPAWER